MVVRGGIMGYLALIRVHEIKSMYLDEMYSVRIVYTKSV